MVLRRPVDWFVAGVDSCVEKFLGNPFYHGLIRIKRSGETYQGSHDPLISEDLFQRVTEVRAGKSGKKVTKHQHLLRGLFSCGHCQRSMIPEKQKSFVYYRCQHPTCPSNSIREEPLSDKLHNVIHSHELSAQCIVAINDKAETWSDTCSTTSQKDTTKLQISRFEERIIDLEEAAINKIISPEQFHERKAALLLQKASLEKKLLQSTKFYQNPAAIQHFLERLKNLAKHYDFATPTEKREIIEIATSNRFVKDKSVAVEPANWLVKTQTALGVFSCAESRTTSRISGLEIKGLETLAEIARSPEVQRLHAIFMRGYENAAQLTAAPKLFGKTVPDDNQPNV